MNYTAFKNIAELSSVSGQYSDILTRWGRPNLKEKIFVGCPATIAKLFENKLWKEIEICFIESV